MEAVLPRMSATDRNYGLARLMVKTDCSSQVKPKAPVANK